MSPRIGMTLALDGWAMSTRTPTGRVRAALLRVRAQGLPLGWGDCGVVWRPLVAPLLGAWARAAATRPVSVVGAVLLAFQPTWDDEAAASRDPTAASAEALGVSTAWAEGLADGWDRAAQSARLLGVPSRDDYLDGYETGMEARFEETTVCPGCELRRFRDERVCSRCQGTW